MDRAKIKDIERIPYPKDIKGIRSFLSHVGFYRRFIKDFSKTSRPLANLLQKDMSFVFDEDFKEFSKILKKSLKTAPMTMHEHSTSSH